MDIGKSCKEGRIEISDFYELLGMRPRRTHFLDVGDYVVLTPTSQEEVYRGENACRGAVLEVEEIAELDSPERGDFVTIRGTIAPINGNVFVKVQKDKSPRYSLIEGDRIGEAGCPMPVYDLINKYVESRISFTK
ncbi:MAG: hypothetical protein Q8N88_06600 [Nanoarchaeota archaeon]|nr:hypothetical protein [Nanoarchaeota archaeon]